MSCSTVADIREARTTFGKAHFALTNMSACQKMFCRLLEIQKIYSRRKKLCAVLQEKTISVRSDGFWRLSSPRSSELLPDQWPPPSRYRARKWERDRRRALYRRHIVFDCLRSLWERGTALFRRNIVCLLVVLVCGRETHHTISGPSCRQGIGIWLAELWFVGYHETCFMNQKCEDRVRRWQQKSARLRSNRRRREKHIACATANGPDKNRLFQQSRIGWIVVVSLPSAKS